jgi:hypothetical protein
MSRKRKHYETCPSCAFIHAHRLKYGKDRYKQKAFNELVYAATKLGAAIMTKLDSKGKAEFMFEMVHKAAKLGGIDAGEVRACIEAAAKSSVAKGPTKH